MTPEEILTELEKLGTEKGRQQNKKLGAGDNQYGVPLGKIRALAKTIKGGHELALSLWESENIDARFLAILLLKPKKLSREEMNRLVCSLGFSRVADWFSSYIAKKHPENEELRREWMRSSDPWPLGQVGV